MKLPVQQWVWRAQYDHAHDGDTVTLYLDRGVGDYTLIPIRLLEAYAPELHGANADAGHAAALFTQQWMIDNGSSAKWPFIVRTYKPDPREKFGRWLGRIFSVKSGRCLNEDIVAAGFATKEPNATATP